MKKYVRYAIYLVLFSILFGIFIYLGKKDFGNDYKKYTDAQRINFEYNEIPSDNMFKYVYATDVLELFDNGTGIIYMGFSSNEWSKYYMKYLYQVLSEHNIKEAYYYDLQKDRSRYTKNYVKIEKELNNFITRFDDNTTRITTPLLVIIKEGKIIYVNNDTAIVDNGINPAMYWTSDRIFNFKYNLSNAIEGSNIYG